MRLSQSLDLSAYYFNTPIPSHACLLLTPMSPLHACLLHMPILSHPCTLYTPVPFTCPSPLQTHPITHLTPSHPYPPHAPVPFTLPFLHMPIAFTLSFIWPIFPFTNLCPLQTCPSCPFAHLSLHMPVPVDEFQWFYISSNNRDLFTWTQKLIFRNSKIVLVAQTWNLQHK